MSRDIKFRVWDIKDKKFIPYQKDTYIETVDGDVYEITSEGCCGGIEINKLRAEIMQFTGLTDKNNVEIYEGDIIKAKIGVMDFIFKVVFEHGKFMAVEGDDDDDELTAFDLFTITDKCEVIGNLHENPEMLK